ncbi:MAG: hypothetical protein ACREVV_19445 [Steroidobacteraceae bacterium]
MKPILEDLLLATYLHFVFNFARTDRLVTHGARLAGAMSAPGMGCPRATELSARDAGARHPAQL